MYERYSRKHRRFVAARLRHGATNRQARAMGEAFADYNEAWRTARLLLRNYTSGPYGRESEQDKKRKWARMNAARDALDALFERTGRCAFYSRVNRDTKVGAPVGMGYFWWLIRVGMADYDTMVTRMKKGSNLCLQARIRVKARLDADQDRLKLRRIMRGLLRWYDDGA